MTRTLRTVVTALCITASVAAQAGAPQVKGQAPGWYRMMLGDFEVTALSDGTAALPVDQLLTGVRPGALRRALARAHLGEPLEPSVNGQFANPSVTISFDTDAGAAAPQRKMAFADAARRGYDVAGAHLSFPGIGRLRADGKGYSWIPVNYSSGK